jgi:hypothetical protein
MVLPARSPSPASSPWLCVYKIGYFRIYILVGIINYVEPLTVLNSSPNTSAGKSFYKAKLRNLALWHCHSIPCHFGRSSSNMAKEDPLTDEYHAETSPKQGHIVCGLCDVSAFLGPAFLSREVSI